jgi:uncharacterized protein
MMQSIPFKRRDFLRLGLGAGAAMFGYGSLVERRFPVVERVDCLLPARHAGLDGLTIALMSDFHHDDFDDDTLMDRAIAATNALRPDLVMLTGDFISQDVAGLDALGGHLRRLVARLGVFGTLGNHDQWGGRSREVTRRLEKSGVAILRNHATGLRAPSGARFFAAGLESAWAGHPDLARALRGVPEDAPVLLGWHEPDPFDSIDDSRVLLQLAGHTHGGQVRVPFYGALQLPAYGRKYVAGLFRQGGRCLYVTRGIGALGVPVRFCCPPEISFLTLRAGSPA